MTRTTPAALVLLAALVAAAAAPALAACGKFKHCSTEDWTACTEVGSVITFINGTRGVESEPFACLSNVRTIKGSLGDIDAADLDVNGDHTYNFPVSFKGLEKVTRVDGDLGFGTPWWSVNFEYQDLSALGAIKSVGGLSFSGIGALFSESPTELPFAAQLEEIGDGGIDISDSLHLKDLSFPALTSVAGTVHLADNDELESFSLGNAAVSLRGDGYYDTGIDIQNNDKLRRVALGNVATTAGLVVAKNAKLEHLSFGSGPTVSTSNVSFVQNGDLEDLSALSGFSRIQGTLTLKENWKLASACLCKLHFVDHLVFEANPELDCQELRAYLDPLSRHPSSSSNCTGSKRAGSASCDCDSGSSGSGSSGSGSSISTYAVVAIAVGGSAVVAAFALVVWRRRRAASKDLEHNLMHGTEASETHV